MQRIQWLRRTVAGIATLTVLLALLLARLALDRVAGPPSSVDRGGVVRGR